MNLPALGLPVLRRLRADARAPRPSGGNLLAAGLPAFRRAASSVARRAGGLADEALERIRLAPPFAIGLGFGLVALSIALPGVVLLAALGLAGVAASMWLAVFALVDRMETRAKLHRQLHRLQRMALHPGAETDDARSSEPIAGGGGRRALGGLDVRYPLAGGRRVAIAGGAAGVAAGVFAWQAIQFVFTDLTALSAVVLGIGIGLFGFLQVGKAMEGAKRRAYDAQTLMMVDQVMQMIRFGMSIEMALQRIGDKAEPPLADSLHRILGIVRFGVPIASALADEARRVRSRDLAMVAAVVKTNAETGAGVSGALEKLGGMLRERHEAARKAWAATAEARATILVLAALPVVGIAGQWFMQPETIHYLLDEGRHLIGIGVGLILIGLFIARSIVRGAGV